LDVCGHGDPPVLELSAIGDNEIAAADANDNKIACHC
jgi:hypothetical protein